MYFSFSATVTSGDDDIGGDEDCFGCSFKTVIHRPTPHFYLPSIDNVPQLVPSPPPLPPSTLIPAPPIPLLVLPSPPVNLPMHHRAHTDPDLLFYNQQPHPVIYQANWYPPLPPGFIYGPHPPPFVMHQISFRSSSVDCRRTANNVNEPHVIHPERVW